MSVAQVNTFLHAVLMQKGCTCDWADERLSESARTAQRAAERFQRWRQERGGN